MKFSVYTGIFTCHTCHETVSQARFWYDTNDFTWRCDEGHVSKVELVRKRRGLQQA